jgi:hypothetical protein
MKNLIKFGLGLSGLIRFLFGLLIVGILFLLLIRRALNRKWTEAQGIRAIHSVFTGTKYQKLIPYLIAQFKHETGDGTSRIYQESANLFGMKVPTRRKTKALGEKYGHAVYKNPTQSAIDMLYYLTFVNFPTVISGTPQYVLNLKARNYFEDSYENYLKGMTRNSLNAEVLDSSALSGNYKYNESTGKLEETTALEKYTSAGFWKSIFSYI